MPTRCEYYITKTETLFWTGFPRATPLAHCAPYLVALRPDSGLLERLVREGWGARWGIFFACARPFKDVRRHLRRFLLVEDDVTAEKYYFRFYDPRTLRVFLPSCTPRQRADFFGEIACFFAEGERGELRRFTPEPAVIVKEPAVSALALEVASGAPLDVRRFFVREAVSRALRRLRRRPVARTRASISTPSSAARPRSASTIGGEGAPAQERRWAGHLPRRRAGAGRAHRALDLPLPPRAGALAPDPAARSSHLPAPHRARHRRRRARPLGRSSATSPSTPPPTCRSPTRSSTRRAITPSSAASWRRRGSPSPSLRAKRWTACSRSATGSTPATPRTPPIPWVPSPNERCSHEIRDRRAPRRSEPPRRLHDPRPRPAPARISPLQRGRARAGAGGRLRAIPLPPWRLPGRHHGRGGRSTPVADARRREPPRRRAGPPPRGASARGRARGQARGDLPDQRPRPLARPRLLHRRPPAPRPRRLAEAARGRAHARGGAGEAWTFRGTRRSCRRAVPPAPPHAAATGAPPERDGGGRRRHHAPTNSGACSSSFPWDRRRRRARSGSA